jgi:hypothetical protein
MDLTEVCMVGSDLMAFLKTSLAEPKTHGFRKSTLRSRKLKERHNSSGTEAVPVVRTFLKIERLAPLSTVIFQYQILYLYTT